MNDRIQIDLPLKKIRKYRLYFVFRIDLIKNGKFATCVFWSFQLKLQYLKSSESVVL